MASDNIQTFGTSLSWAGTAIGTIRAIAGPGESVESEDITNHDSPGSYREKVPTLIDGGEVSFEIIYSHEAGQAALRAAFAARTVAEVIIELPDTAGTSGTTFTFDAFISKWDWAVPDAGALKGTVSITVAGAVAFEVVRWAGVAYLVYMGLTMMLAGGDLRLDDEEPSTVSMGRVVRRGILLNLLNPKLTLFFFAFLPQFLETAPGLLDGRLVLLGGVFVLMTLVVFAGYAYLSAAIRDRLLGSPSALTWLQRSLGALLIGFAAKLAVADR